MLRRGIHSELFLLAYAKPESGYGIARRHQDTIRRPDTSKTSKALDRLEESGYLYLKNKKYYPNFEKLSYELFRYLNSKDIKLDEIESKFFKRLIEENLFFMFLGQDTLYRILIQPTRIHHIDALQIICSHVGMMCTQIARSRKMNISILTEDAKRKSISKISEEFDIDILDANKEIETIFKGSKFIRKKKIDAAKSIDDPMKSLVLGIAILEKAPLSMLEKLEHLWENHDGFKIGASVHDPVKALFS